MTILKIEIDAETAMKINREFGADFIAKVRLVHEKNLGENHYFYLEIEVDE